MPVAKSPPPPNSAGSYAPAGVTAGETLLKGAAVAIVDDGGVRKILLCGANLYAYSFVGFAAGPVTDGNSGTIVMGRGSLVAPVVEGGVPLVVNQPVFLAGTLGEVTQTAPGAGFVLRVGMAVSTTQMVLLTDYAVVLPA